MPDDLRSRILRAARVLDHLEYRLDPPPDGVTSIDCSLLVVLAARDAGVALPAGVRTAEQIRQATVPIGWDEVLPGDLLFFAHTYEPSEPPGPDGHVASHVGFSLGAGSLRMLDAHERPGPDVAETDISTAYWQEKLLSARRLPGLADADHGPTPTETLLGVDVSSHQGAVDWQAVAASGVTFAITKATGGTWYRNPTFARNWLGIKAAGLVRGAYHFAFESSGQLLPGDGPEAEAEYFVAELKRAGGVEAGDLLALDLEDGAGQLGDWCLRWLRRVEVLTGIRPLLYTGAWFSVPHGLGAVTALADYPLWLADYGGEWPDAPPPWQEVNIWQHADDGRVPGIAGNVDLNQFPGSREQLLALGKPAPAEPEPSPFVVGPGILERMADLGDVPASDEEYVARGWSEAVGVSGRIYRWVKFTNTVVVYDPAA